MSERLPAQPGEWIDRSRPQEFRFEGQPLRGYAGDVIANGVRVLGRSFKYHRPRGLASLAGHDANALFTDGVRTNLRAAGTPLEAGMELRAVNTVGGVRHDRLQWLERMARFMPVGFYYKAFHRPRWLFPWFESAARRLAGLGRINRALAPEAAASAYAWCDVLVVGGGPAGLEAALAAGRAGARVLLVEEQARLGGSLAWQYGGGDEARATLDELCCELEALENVEVRCATTAGGHYADHWVALFDARGMTRVRARAVVYATGAIEQPAVFGNNDLPGVLLGSACQQLVRWYAVRPGRRAVVLAANRDAYRVALDLQAAGSEVVLIADLRPDGEPSSLGGEAAAAGIPVLAACTVYEALAEPRTGTLQGALVARVGIAPADGSGAAGRAVDLRWRTRIACDTIVLSVGWTPNAVLPSQAGVPFRYDEERAQLLPDGAPEGVFLAGRVRGVYELAGQREDGRGAGLRAACAAGRGDQPERAPVPVDRSACSQSDPMVQHPGHGNPEPALVPADGEPRSHPYPIFEHPGHKNFVDLDEDLHLADLANAHQEGFDSVELLKRYSTVGMGPSQGKLANLNAARVVAQLNGRSMAHTGTTTARPFYQPVPLGHLAGLRHHPMRRTPLHDWHEQAGAVLIHAGDWYRPEYYPSAGTERGTCIVQEARQVREGLGMIDVSTLGKLLVNGPDAAELLERIYTGRFRKLAVGRCRYGVALDESGIVIEDGVIARLAPDRFYVSATSSGVASFYREMTRWATIWGLEVTLSDATGHYAALNLAGPHSREALQPLADLDLSAEAFTYLAVAEATVCRVPALVLRVGFVGELGFEVHVPAWHGEHVWRTLFEAGARWEVRPFGLEAQRLLRLEKGHLIVGHDTDALTHPSEVGLNWAIGKGKRFFVGQRSLPIHAARPALRTLVGVRWPDGHQGPLPEECNLIIHDGRITSIAPGIHPGLSARPGIRRTGAGHSRHAGGGAARRRLGEYRRGGRAAVLRPRRRAATAMNDARTSPLRALVAAPAPVRELLSHPDELVKRGVKGPGVVAWAQRHDLPLPANRYAVLPVGAAGVLARAGEGELVLECTPQDALWERWQAALAESPGRGLRHPAAVGDPGAERAARPAGAGPELCPESGRRAGRDHPLHQDRRSLVCRAAAWAR